MAPACWLSGSVGGGFKKRTMASACHSVWEKAVSQLLPWCQTLHFLSLCHWCLLSCYPGAGAQREWVLSKSVCGFFKGHCLGLQKFLPLTQSPLVFAARSSEDLPSWHWNPGLVDLGWGWDSWFPRYFSSIFIHYTWMWDQPVCVSFFLPVWMDVVSLIL